ncbi:hypothetical protein QBC39DRAFT_332080 [Podospora conica]|nr:hypothetical protein QBC39DRAFT_332080 [Schizothecium conicum]
MTTLEIMPKYLMIVGEGFEMRKELVEQIRQDICYGGATVGQVRATVAHSLSIADPRRIKVVFKGSDRLRPLEGDHWILKRILEGWPPPLELIFSVGRFISLQGLGGTFIVHPPRGRNAWIPAWSPISWVRTYMVTNIFEFSHQEQQHQTATVVNYDPISMEVRLNNPPPGFTGPLDDELVCRYGYGRFLDCHFTLPANDAAVFAVEESSVFAPVSIFPGGIDNLPFFGVSKP